MSANMFICLSFTFTLVYYLAFAPQYLLPVTLRIKDVIFSITASLNKLISPSQPLPHFGCQYNTSISLQYFYLYDWPRVCTTNVLGCNSLCGHLIYLAFFYFYPCLLSVKSVGWKGASVECLGQVSWSHNVSDNKVWYFN